MTPDHVRAQLRRAVVTAVRAGKRCKRTGLSEVMHSSADFAELLVLPPVEAMVDEAVETALRNACRRWEPGEPDTGPPSPASPLWGVWAGGARYAIDVLSVMLGVNLDDDSLLTGEDVADLVRGEIAKLLSEARQSVG